MELDNLRSTWKNIDKNEKLDKKLGQEEIAMLLHKRSIGRIQKLDRNIKVCFVLIFVFLSTEIIFQFLDPATISEKLKGVEIPSYITITSLLMDFAFLAIFSIFVRKYKKLQIHQISASTLPKAIISLINTLHTFKKQFYICLAMFGIDWTFSFIIGFNQGISLENHGNVPLGETNDKILIILLGFVAMAIIIVPIIFLFHWGFNKLYGQYYNQFKSILKELNETD